MAKYRKKNYRRYYRKGRWSPNIQELLTTQITAPASSTFYQTITLTTNPVQDTSTVSQIYTVKNFSIDFYIDSDDSPPAIEDVCVYIIYVPQGMNVTDNYNILHPEYILNYKYLGGTANDANQYYQPFRIRSRLARKLNTGDSVQLLIKGINQLTNSSARLHVHGLFRWWTKAN